MSTNKYVIWKKLRGGYDIKKFILQLVPCKDIYSYARLWYVASQEEFEHMWYNHSDEDIHMHIAKLLEKGGRLHKDWKDKLEAEMELWEFARAYEIEHKVAIKTKKEAEKLRYSELMNRFVEGKRKRKQRDREDEELRKKIHKENVEDPSDDEGKQEEDKKIERKEVIPEKETKPPNTEQ